MAAMKVLIYLYKMEHRTAEAFHPSHLSLSQMIMCRRHLSMSLPGQLIASPSPASAAML
jgi:hypothetical protein